MRGKQKGTKQPSDYYGKRGGSNNGRREGEEFSNYPQYKQNQKPRNYPKRGGYDSRDKEYGYKYISKDKKVYETLELFDLFDKAYIDENALFDLKEEFGALMIEEPFSDYIGSTISISESWYVENTDKEFNPKATQNRNQFMGQGNRPYGNRYNRDDDQNFGDDHQDNCEATDKLGRVKRFEKFAFDDDDDMLDDVDKKLEEKFKQRQSDNRDMCFNNDDMPDWAVEEGIEEDMPIWSNINTQDIMADTENTAEWETNNLKNFQKDDFAMFNNSIEEDNQKNNESYKNKEFYENDNRASGLEFLEDNGNFDKKDTNKGVDFGMLERMVKSGSNHDNRNMNNDTEVRFHSDMDYKPNKIQDAFKDNTNSNLEREAFEKNLTKIQQNTGGGGFSIFGNKKEQASKVGGYENLLSIFVNAQTEGDDEPRQSKFINQIDNSGSKSNNTNSNYDNGFGGNSMDNSMQNKGQNPNLHPFGERNNTMEQHQHLQAFLGNNQASNQQNDHMGFANKKMPQNLANQVQENIHQQALNEPALLGKMNAIQQQIYLSQKLGLIGPAGGQVQNPNMQNPNMQNLNMQNPNMHNPNMHNPNMQNPNIQGQHLQKMMGMDKDPRLNAQNIMVGEHQHMQKPQTKGIEVQHPKGLYPEPKTDQDSKNSKKIRRWI